ncbi:MAG: DoxX family protein, partial [Steroidobacteraceae bacterium]
HIHFKAFGNPPPASEFFIKAGYPHPLVFMRIALIIEITTSSLLFLNIYTHYVALMCTGMLSVAAVSVFFANDKKWIWLWPKGGKEYPIFWALTCVAVSMLYWP